MRVHNSLVPHLREYFGPTSLVVDHQPQVQSARSSMKTSSQTREAGHASLGNLNFDIPPANYQDDPAMNYAVSPHLNIPTPYHPIVHDGAPYDTTVDTSRGTVGQGNYPYQPPEYLSPWGDVVARAIPVYGSDPGIDGDAGRGANPSPFGDLRSLSTQPSWMSGGGGGPLGMGFGFLRAQ